MPNKNVSLTSWCNYHKLNKSTVYRRCQEMHINVADGLTDEAVRVLEKEFNVQKNSSATEPQPSNVSVEVGNHSMVLSDVSVPAQFTLEGLRTGESMEISDPLAVAASFLQTAHVLKTAMAQDIQQRQEKLNQTKQARDAIAAETQELTLEARLYQLQRELVDGQLTEETQQLTDELGKLQRFAKPSERSPQSEPPSAS